MRLCIINYSNKIIYVHLYTTIKRYNRYNNNIMSFLLMNGETYFSLNWRLGIRH